jgi:hypothetical protein
MTAEAAPVCVLTREQQQSHGGSDKQAVACSDLFPAGSDAQMQRCCVALSAMHERIM